MNRFLLLVSIAAVSLATGCDAGDTHPTTAAEKKSFLGGPMPADMRQKWQESMRHSGPPANVGATAPAAGKPSGSG